MFGARLWARMPPEYLVALKTFAFQSGVPLAEYVRGMVHDHILEGGAALRERGAALRAFINAGKTGSSPTTNAWPLRELCRARRDALNLKKLTLLQVTKKYF